MDQKRSSTTHLTCVVLVRYYSMGIDPVSDDSQEFELKIKDTFPPRFGKRGEGKVS